jgi:hypothetical protein
VVKTEAKRFQGGFLDRKDAGRPPIDIRANPHPVSFPLREDLVEKIVDVIQTAEPADLRDINTDSPDHC